MKEWRKENRRKERKIYIFNINTFILKNGLYKIKNFIKIWIK